MRKLPNVAALSPINDITSQTSSRSNELLQIYRKVSDWERPKKTFLSSFSVNETKKFSQLFFLTFLVNDNDYKFIYFTFMTSENISPTATAFLHSSLRKLLVSDVTLYPWQLTKTISQTRLMDCWISNIETVSLSLSGNYKSAKLCFGRKVEKFWKVNVDSCMFTKNVVD